MVVWVVTLAALYAFPVASTPARCRPSTGRSSRVYLVWIVWDGIRLSKDTDKLEGYFLASRSLPWWAVGLSVMATQLSAITMVSTTGQGYADGMGLLQQYYALPIAMIIISVTFVPFFRHANVYTAYEFLERRFDAKTRSFTALLFLLSRGMSTRRRHLGAGRGAVGDDRRGRQHDLRPARACRPPSTRCTAACRRWPGPTSSRCT